MPSGDPTGPTGPTIPSHLELTDRSVPTCALNVPLPWPVDERVGRLAALIAAEKLGPIAKKELVAALIQTAEESGLQLWERVLRYRHATVADAAFWLPSDEAEMTFEERKRGRPGG
jgi:hypothetical protein